MGYTRYMDPFPGEGIYSSVVAYNRRHFCNDHRRLTSGRQRVTMAKTRQECILCKIQKTIYLESEKRRKGYGDKD